MTDPIASERAMMTLEVAQVAYWHNVARDPRNAGVVRGPLRSIIAEHHKRACEHHANLIGWSSK